MLEVSVGGKMNRWLGRGVWVGGQLDKVGVFLICANM